MTSLKDIFMDMDDGPAGDENAIEVYADSVKQAMELAALEFDADIHMLDYEIIEKGTKGLFGFGRQPYRVLIRKIESDTTLTDFSKLESKLLGEAIEPEYEKNRNGEFQIRVIKSGVFIKVSPPRGSGHPVDIMAVSNKLYSMKLTEVDMTKVEKAIKAQTGEPVKLADWTPNPAHDGTMSVEMTEDEMKVFVHFTPPRYAGRHMEVDEVVAALKKAGTAVGIKTEEIEKYLDAMDYTEPLLAAEGVSPREGNDAYIDYKVRTEDDEFKFKEDDQGNIDFKDKELLENVVQGQVLAVKIPAEEGVPGRTVTNKILPAKSGKDVKFVYGKGTILSEDGTELTAEINGQVVFVNGKITVEPVYIVNGDVSLETGNIVFLGSVVVTGSVQDNFSVKAAGNIEVKGTVQKSFLEAEGDIIVRQGISGREEARVESTGGSVYAKFVQQATVIGEKDVIVPEGIMHSYVDAGKRIISIGRRARIIGGRCRAGDEINSRFIGGENSPKTEVRVGINPKVLQQMHDLETQKNAFVEEIESKAKDIVTLETQKKSKRLAPDKEKMLSDLISRRDKLQKRIEDIDQDIEELTTYIDQLEFKGKISAEKTAFSGVDVFVKQEEFPLRDPYNSVTFSLQGGQIKITDYERPQLEESDQKIRTLARR